MLRSVVLSILPVSLGLALAPATAHAKPTTTPSVQRIRAHLTAVHKQLIGRDVSTLSPSVRRARQYGLHLLSRYIKRGKFPQRDGDPYSGRRPRFIDHRGIHCAVGYLIANTGHAALARDINARYEYSYVRDIRSQRLLVWAKSHGFTVAELARIQPGYDPATERSVRERIKASTLRWTNQCAKRRPVPKQLRIRVSLSKPATVRVSARNGGRFGRCFAKLASGRYADEQANDAKPARFNMTLRIPSPHVALAQVVKEMHTAVTRCRPRPGPLPRTARLQVTTISAPANKKTFKVSVTTQPANPEISACFTTYARRQLASFTPATWALRIRKTIRLEPTMTARRLLEILKAELPGTAALCRRRLKLEPKTRGRIAVRVTARRDAAKLRLVVSARSKPLAACIKRFLQPQLRSRFVVWRPRKPSGYTTFFRIDANASAGYRVE